jgi:predicted transcriptional regulator
MKKHSGMRPHDIVVLLKIASKGNTPWLMKDLASELAISAGEISESLHRSAHAGLIRGDKKQILASSLIEFLQCGLKYVFPVHCGSVVRGMPTAYSAAPLNADIQSGDMVVWPFAEGTIRGQAITPLYPGVPKACLHDKSLYELLTLTDALRIGKARERTLAVKELKRRLL